MSSFPNTDPRFDSVLMSRQVPREQWAEYKKWVRFYLHFFGKYRHNSADISSISPFLEKLVSKNQTAEQQQQAQRAVELYIQIWSPGSSTALSEKKEVPPLMVKQMEAGVTPEKSLPSNWLGQRDIVPYDGKTELQISSPLSIPNRNQYV